MDDREARFRMPKRSWSDDDLAEAVRASTNLAGVNRLLGLKNRRYESIRRHIERLGLDVGHLDMSSRADTRRGAWTDADLRRVVEESRSYNQVMRSLGYVPSGGIHRWLEARMRALGLSTDHFSGQGWARGTSVGSQGRARPLEDLLQEGVAVGSANLRRRLIAAGLLDARCSGCGLVEWRGSALPLALDHISGDPLDNRLENLRILCPNCHAITPTWCARNRKPA